MNAGKIETSPRLRATLAALREAGSRGMTTLEIEQWTNSRAVHSDVAALRVNGISVACRYDGRSDAGSKIYRYSLVERTFQDPSNRCGACDGPLDDHRSAVCEVCVPESEWFRLAAEVAHAAAAAVRQGELF